MALKERKKKSKEKASEKVPEHGRGDVAPRDLSAIPWGRIRARVGMALILMVVVYFYNEYNVRERTLASSSVKIDKAYEEVSCSKDYKKEISLFPECVPKKCGRVVTDAVISETEALHLLRMAKAGLALGGSNGGASILDLHSGAVSKGDKFVNVYSIMQENNEQIFTEKDFQVYKKVKDKIHRTIAEAFGVTQSTLYLTSPTFFSRMNIKSAKTVHDEYWHVHVDKETYGSFHYTSLLYLSDHGTDFTGGRFIFADGSKNVTVEPRLGRLSFFTSGSENAHFVEKLQSGTRYAITVSFTCDPSKAIDDPKLK